MTYSQNLWLYFVLLFGIIIVPGMDMLFVLVNALADGRRGGLAATGGIMAGGAFHTIFGATAVLTLSTLAPTLFVPLIFIGSAYMAWIGLSLIRSTGGLGEVTVGKSRSRWVAFRQGAVTCMLNPKAYLFVFAVYPQFLRPQYGAIWSQALIMGIMTALMQLSVYGGMTLVASRGRDMLVSNPGTTLWATRFAGLLFIVVAGFTVWHGFQTV